MGVSLAIDSRLLLHPLTGVGNHLLGVVRGVAAVRPELGMDLLAWSPVPAVCVHALPAAAALRVGSFGHGEPPEQAWRAPDADVRLDWGRFTRARVLHSPEHVPPPAEGRRRTVTLHDLAILRSEWQPAHREGETVASIGRDLGRADHVFTVSRAVRDEILGTWPLAAERVSVMYNALAPALVIDPSAESLAAMRRRLGFGGPFVAYVSTLEPKKNHRRLVEAFVRARAELGSEWRLVLAGGDGWKVDGLLARLTQPDARACVVRLGHLDGSELGALYRLAAGTIFPSEYEGFGMPVLESLACGTPVATSRDPALREVAGDAALHFDAHDADAIADALLALARPDAATAQRVELGRGRAAQFTWENAARELLRVVDGLGRAPR